MAARVRGGNPLAITGAVRAAVFAVDRDAPIYEVRAMPQVVTDGTWFYGLGAGIVGVCGVAALLLSAVGVYGVVAFSVGQLISHCVPRAEPSHDCAWRTCGRPELMPERQVEERPVKSCPPRSVDV